MQPFVILAADDLLWQYGCQRQVSVGRVIAIRKDDYTLLCSDAPDAGTYLIRVSNTPNSKAEEVRWLFDKLYAH